MNKKLWTLIAILILIVGCLAIHDLIQTKQVKSKLESMEVQISKTDNVEETRINLEITGEIPKAYTKLTVFADNRYLEFQPGLSRISCKLNQPIYEKVSSPN